MATKDDLGYHRKFQRFTGGVGVNDNDLVISALGVQEYDTHFLISTAGAMDVVVSLDGVNYATAPLSLQDFGATGLAPVIVTEAGRLYVFRGNYPAIRVLQNGATAVAGATLLSSRLDL